jgi:hypothetical protein
MLLGAGTLPNAALLGSEDADPGDALASVAATVSAPAASDAAAATDPAAAPDPQAALRSEADLCAQSGLAALKDATSDPQQAVAAVLAFTQALKIYQRLGDTGRVTEMQAQLFWCKKNMNLDALAALSGAGATAPPASGAPAGSAGDAQDAAEPVPEDQAQTYFDSAVDFRKNHPDQHYLNAIRFGAVVACFGDAQSASVRALVAKATAIAAEERAAYQAAGGQDPAQEVASAPPPAAAAAGDADAGDAQRADPPPPGNPPAPAAAPPAQPAANGTPTPPSAAVRAQWGGKLYARVREEIARKRPPRFTSSLIHDTMEVVAADDDGNLQLATGDSTLSWTWKRIPDQDRVSLAVGMVRDAVPDDHCIAAFYLYLAGNPKDADHQLLKVGKPGDDVRALFGLPPR